MSAFLLQHLPSGREHLGLGRLLRRPVNKIVDFVMRHQRRQRVEVLRERLVVTQRVDGVVARPAHGDARLQLSL